MEKLKRQSEREKVRKLKEEEMEKDNRKVETEEARKLKEQEKMEKEKRKAEREEARKLKELEKVEKEKRKAEREEARKMKEQESVAIKERKEETRRIEKEERIKIALEEAAARAERLEIRRIEAEQIKLKEEAEKIEKKNERERRRLEVERIHQDEKLKKQFEYDQLTEKQKEELRQLNLQKKNAAVKRLEYLEQQTKIFSHFVNKKGQSSGEKNNNIIVKKKKKTFSYKSSPPYIVGEMHDYQVDGLNWMISLNENGLNGILADEMGLGKTIQTISLLGHLKSQGKLKNTNLIIVPLSTLNNWMIELKRFCPSLKAYRYYASKDERKLCVQEIQKNHYDVIVTSYEVFKMDIGYFKQNCFQYLIVDEAHSCKNLNIQFSQKLRQLQTSNILLLTGTPLQNTVHQLWALLNFLQPDIFNDAEDFNEWFNDEETIRSDVVAQKLKDILNPFMLRRIKAEVESKILPKKFVDIFLPVTEMQKVWTKRVIDNNLVKQVNGMRMKTTALNSTMNFRKAANHPYLFLGAEAEPYKLGEHLITNSTKLVTLDKILVRLKAQGSRVLIFSQFVTMLTILEDYMFYRNFSYFCLDGLTPIDERQNLIEKFNSKDSDVFVFMISTKAGGLGINLTGADTVIFYDMDWNPQNDIQAEDRSHRIGQTKQVRIFRMICQGTMDELIYACAERKRMLDNVVIQSKKFTDEQRQQILKYSRENYKNLVVDDACLTDEEADALVRMDLEPLHKFYKYHSKVVDLKLLDQLVSSENPDDFENETCLEESDHLKRKQKHLDDVEVNKPLKVRKILQMNN